VTGPATSGPGGGGEELGDGKVGHARGADLGYAGEQVQSVYPVGRQERQLGATARWWAT